MLKPLRSKGVAQGKINGSTTLIAPTKGWYVGENITNSPAGTAYILDNCFPQYDYIRVRRGSLAWATGMGSSTTVNTLMPYRSGVSNKLFAAAGTSIYDVTGTGAVGAAVVTGLASTTMQYIQFTTTGGTFLLWCNGSDPMQIYDGRVVGLLPRSAPLRLQQLPPYGNTSPACLWLKKTA